VAGGLVGSGEVEPDEVADEVPGQEQEGVQERGLRWNAGAHGKEGGSRMLGPKEATEGQPFPSPRRGWWAGVQVWRSKKATGGSRWDQRRRFPSDIYLPRMTGPPPLPRFPVGPFVAPGPQRRPKRKSLSKMTRARYCMDGVKQNVVAIALYSAMIVDFLRCQREKNMFLNVSLGECEVLVCCMVHVCWHGPKCTNDCGRLGSRTA